MPQQLKNMFFQPEFIEELGNTIKEAYPSFDSETFRRLVFDKTWTSLELKDRMRHVTRALQKTLPKEYLEALSILQTVGPRFKGFDAMVFPDYVETYGMGHFDVSMETLEQFTSLCSSEFAVRPFLDLDPDRGMIYHRRWVESDSVHVRRLASEGCRPRLPWAMALPKFKKDPSSILPILEVLKDDQSESVRRSVANNLNDISKDNPEIALATLESWLGRSEQLDRVAKHAARTLLKAGDTRALVLFGFGDPSHVDVLRLVVDNPNPAVGETIRFTFDLDVQEDNSTLLRLEYGVWYVKARGKLSRKIFQIREGLYEPGSHSVSRKLSLQERSTRKHYPGEHQIDIIANGKTKATTTFDLTE